MDKANFRTLGYASMIALTAVFFAGLTVAKNTLQADLADRFSVASSFDSEANCHKHRGRFGIGAAGAILPNCRKADG